MKRADEIVAEVAAKVTGRDYSHTINRALLASVAREQTDTVTVCCGGFRLVVTSLEGVLISVRVVPRANVEGEIVLWAGGQESAFVVLTIAGRAYWHNRLRGSQRLHAALEICASAWEQSGGTAAGLYKAIGARGYCAMCGALLTDPLSVARGIGPECIERVDRVARLQETHGRNAAR